MSIPVRVDPSVKAHVVRSGFLLNADHPLVDQPCPVCDEPLGELGIALVYVGRFPDNNPGWTAASVAVHDSCTDVTCGPDRTAAAAAFLEAMASEEASRAPATEDQP